VPIACGGQAVMPGDIIVGDPDGIVVIHKDDAQYIIDDVVKKIEFEHNVLRNYREGNLNREQYRANYEAILHKIGASFLD